MKNKKTKSQSVYRLTLCIWGIFVIGHLVFYLFRAYSSLPSDEVYANGIFFQLIAFALTLFPVWISVLGIFLLVEFFIFRKK
jgi:hypothetical protein